LRDHKILKQTEYQLLSDGYLFLRRLNHRLRLQRDQSIDAFEREPARLEAIAQSLGYDGSKLTGNSNRIRAGQKLVRDYESRREKIRACYERYFVQDTDAQ
jgi:[glutamine synthetase] adenylyltransferase / [glutamine synthetase]-adenylyl-L-tyrosine phosphorylase